MPSIGVKTVHKKNTYFKKKSIERDFPVIMQFEINGNPITRLLF